MSGFDTADRPTHKTTLTDEWLKRGRMELAQAVNRSYGGDRGEQIDAATHVHHAKKALAHSGHHGLRERINHLDSEFIDARGRFEIRQVMSLIDSELSEADQ